MTVKGREGSVNVMGRKGGNRLFPTLTLTLTFHHPEQSLLHKLHWLDHVIRVGARAPLYNTDQYHLHSFFPDGCLPVLTVLRVSHQERRSVSVTGRWLVFLCARASTNTDP